MVNTGLNILVLCHEYPPIGGGAAAVCAELARHYVLLGHSVCLLTMAFEDLPSCECIEDIAVHRIPCGRRRKEMASPWEGLRWATRCVPLARRLHGQQSFDVIHTHFIMPAGIVANRLKRAEGIPTIITPHGSDVPGYNPDRLKAVHHLVRPWWRRICRQADVIASPSASLLKLLEAKAVDCRSQVVPNGFEPSRFPPLRKEKRILLCSRLVRRKGFHLFLAAIESLDLPGWEVDIVGDGPMYPQLASMAKRCRVPVRMHGWVDNRDPKLAELYGRAMLFVLPSSWENFSIALLEGMGAGCAVVSTDIAGNPEVIGDCGRLIPPNDIGALRRTIIELTGKPEYVQELGRRAAERVAKNFDWETIARRYVALFNSVVYKKDAAACVCA